MKHALTIVKSSPVEILPAGKRTYQETIQTIKAIRVKYEKLVKEEKAQSSKTHVSFL